MDNKRATTNVRQRKDGLWEGRYRADGKQRSVYGKTKKEARDKLTQKLAEDLHSGASSLIDEAKRTGHDATDTMRAVWTYEHDMMIEDKDCILRKLEMYKA